MHGTGKGEPPRSESRRVEIFIINLPSAGARRRLMQAQLESPGMAPHRFIAAVDGRALSGTDLLNVYDDDARKERSSDSLKPSEIGCAASHLAAYRQIVADGVPCAVVLEDDALLGHQFPGVLDDLASTLDPRRPQAILLSHVERYSAWGGRRLDKLHVLYRPYDAHGAHAYVITLAGAQSMLAAFPRVRTVADDWRYFIEARIMDVYALIPYVVGTSPFSLSSRLAEERSIREGSVQLEEPRLERWLKKYLWKRFLFQLVVKPILRLRKAEQTW